MDYLSALITTFQECLYCGQTRDTVLATRQHMMDKGHCRLAPEAAEFSDLVGFYDIEEDGSRSDGAGNASHGHRDDTANVVTVCSKILPDENESVLPSGRTLGHRSKARYSRQNHSHTTSKASTQISIEGSTSNTNQLIGAGSSHSDHPNLHARRAIMSLMRKENANKGLVGVPELEKGALRASEKKMLKREVRVRSLYQARAERGANRQRLFKPDVPGPKNG